MRTAIFSLLTATSCRTHPSQLAGAIALGVAAGLLPKFSGLFVLMLAIAFALPVHLLLTLAIAGVVSLIAASFSGSFSSLGQASLTHPLLADFWMRLDTYPLVPWLRLHNTLVHGTAVVAAAQLIPTLMLSRLALHWLAPCTLRQTRNHAILRVKSRATDSPQTNMPTAQAMASSLATVAPEACDSDCDVDCDLESSLVSTTQFQAVDAALAQSAEFKPLVEDANMDTSSEHENAIDRIEQILAEVEGDHHSDGASSDAVLRRAARLVSAVDDILNVIDAENELDAENVLEADRPTSRVEDDLVGERTAIDSVASPANTHGNRDMLRTDDPLMKNEYRPLGTNKTGITTTLEANTDSASEQSSDAPISVRTRFEQRRISREGEVLRNLLHHLRDLKEKV